MTLLSIVIPAFNRPGELAFALERFAEQIDGKYDDLIEVIVVDDASPNNALAAVKELTVLHDFMEYHCWDTNVGLEQNLIKCTEFASGEYLWIFGDDDYLETDTALTQIVDLLRSNRFDMLVLNRTRRSADLSETLTLNWMGIPDGLETFDGLRQFCLAYGFISVIGFISVNIFRREMFTQISPEPYFGTMYPQLGMMLEAFHNRPVALVGAPLICHRTQTQEEKKIALGNKASEADFMADANRRNALYFSHPYVKMLNHLVAEGAFTPDDIVSIPENTVINGPLVKFLLNSVEESLSYTDEFSNDDWNRSLEFFSNLKLEPKERDQLGRITQRKPVTQRGSTTSIANSARITSRDKGQKTLVETISAITPSFNQAEFLDECLQSVASQSHPAIEHFVYDPGSTDGSQDIARNYESVTLFTEPDNGQSDAINKGFVRAQGDLIAWLNSDDVFAHHDVFARVVERFNQPDQPDIVYGKGVFIAEDGSKLRDCYINKDPASLPWRFQQEDGILQPSLFMRRSVVEDVGQLNGGLHYCMDYEYWIRCVHAGKTFAYVDEDFALARYHSNNKTFGQRGKSYEEVCDMLVNHFGYANHVWLRRYAEFLSDGFDGVLSNAANNAVKSEAEVERHYVKLMKAYNTAVPTFEMLSGKASHRGYGDTLRELKQLALTPSTPCEPIPLETATAPYKTCYTVGPRRWAFDRTWKQEQIEKTHQFFHERIAKREHDVCVIVGNGPSLKKSDLSLLKNADTIISNNAFLDPEIFKHATFYTVVNYLVAEQSSHNINRLEGIPKVLPYWLSYCLNQSDETYFADAVGHAEFSRNIFENMSWRHTVTFYNLHLAYGLGYKRVAMIGFDHFYTQSKDVKEGDIVVSDDDDPNHFDPRYFKGKKWQAADVDMMEAMYRLADTAYREDGREIVNATVGGALELFPRMSLKDAIDMKPIESAKANGITSTHSAEKCTFTPPALPRSKHAGVDETEVIAALLQDRKGRKHTLLDVGAHYGTSASYFDKLDWSIHCFEPDVANHKKLQEKLGHRPNVRLDRRALSHKEAEGVPFFTSEESTGVSGLNSFTESHIQSNKVEVTTIENIAKERDISHVDFLKIDVEGFDFNVLKGVPWDSLKPDVIEAEFEDGKTTRLGHDYKDTCDYLIDKGYAVYLSVWHPIIRYGRPHDWQTLVAYPNSGDYSAEWGNIVAFRDDPGLPALTDAFFKQMHYRNGGTPAAKATNGAAPAVAPNNATPLNTAKPQTSPITPPKLAVAPSTVQPSPSPVRPTSTGDGKTSSQVKETVTAPKQKQAAPNAQVRASEKLPLYTRFTHWASDGHPLIFAVGQFTMWVLRTLKRYPLLLALAVLIGGGLLVVLFAPQLQAYRNVAALLLGAGSLATAVTLISGFQIHLLKRTALDERAKNRRLQSTTAAQLAQARRATTLNEEKTATELQKLRGSFTATSTSLNQVQKDVDDLKTLQIQKVERSLATTATSLTDIKNELHGLKTDRIEKLERSLAEFTASIRKLENELGPHQTSRVEKLEGSLATSADAVSKLADELTALQTVRLEKFENSLETSAAAVARLEKDLGTLQSLRLQKLEGSLAASTAAVSKIEREMGTLETVRRKRMEKLEGSLTTSTSTVSNLEKALHELQTNQLRELEGSLATSTSAITQMRSELDDLPTVRASLDAVREDTQQLKRDTTGLYQLEENFGRRFDESATKLDGVSGELKLSQELIAKVSGSMQDTATRLGAVETQAQQRARPGYVRFNRDIDAEALARYENHWCRELSISMKRNALMYFIDRVILLEDRLHGRLATETQDVLLRTMVAKAVKRPDISILEVGTLFGIGAAVMYDTLKSQFKKIHFTLLDPLDGYYGAGSADIMTGQPVTLDILKENLDAVGMAEHEYEVVQNFSLEEQAIQQVGKRKYDVVILDGDHSYAGLKGDFENYASFVRLGGFIVFDDYDTEDWPDIKRFVDTEVEPCDWLARVGTQSRTAVYKVTSKPTPRSTN